jgi:hypothetical protein
MTENKTFSYHGFRIEISWHVDENNDDGSLGSFERYEPNQGTYIDRKYGVLTQGSFEEDIQRVWKVTDSKQVNYSFYETMLEAEGYYDIELTDDFYYYDEDAGHGWWACVFNACKALKQDLTTMNKNEYRFFVPASNWSIEDIENHRKEYPDYYQKAVDKHGSIQDYVWDCMVQNYERLCSLGSDWDYLWLLVQVFLDDDLISESSLSGLPSDMQDSEFLEVEEEQVSIALKQAFESLENEFTLMLKEGVQL